MNIEFLTLLSYSTLLLLLSAVGLHRLWLAFSARRFEAPEAASTERPTMLVQVPLFNELFVARRVIDAVCRLDYPEDRLRIQVLDDSTDATSAVVAASVREWRQRGEQTDHRRARVQMDGKRREITLGAARHGRVPDAILDGVSERSFHHAIARVDAGTLHPA